MGIQSGKGCQIIVRFFESKISGSLAVKKYVEMTLNDFGVICAEREKETQLENACLQCRLLF